MMNQNRSCCAALLLCQVLLGSLLLFPLDVTHALQPASPLPPTCHHRGSNRLFLDTADTSVWEELLPLGIFHGVTTNPTLLERANQACTISNLHALAQKAFSMTTTTTATTSTAATGASCCHEFMCQAWGSTAEEMYEIGMALSQPDRDRIVIKVPVTTEGTKAAAMLMRQGGVRVCLTACYNSHQAIVASGIGAEYIAPYLGRMTDSGKDGLLECQRMEEIVRGMNSSTRILVASIRDVESMAILMSTNKMDTFTFNPDVARALFSEPLPDQAAEDFEAAAQRGSSS